MAIDAQPACLICKMSAPSILLHLEDVFLKRINISVCLAKEKKRFNKYTIICISSMEGFQLTALQRHYEQQQQQQQQKMQQPDPLSPDIICSV